jgi:hypothetical protein
MIILIRKDKRKTSKNNKHKKSIAIIRTLRRQKILRREQDLLLEI